VGLRGPGETQLEVDRRRARERISFLRKSIERISTAREIHREKRRSVPIPTVSLIGYTNAGKSTLFNELVAGNVLAEDKLFATLDPKTKKLRLPSGQGILLSDTVGFINNLPHQLIEAFKSTFEEVSDADVLLHVIDASHPCRDQQVATVEKVLAELGFAEKPVIRVFNKIDALPAVLRDGIQGDVKDCVYVSGLTGEGLMDLRYAIADIINAKHEHMCLFIPRPPGRVINDLYTHGRVLSTKEIDDGSLIEVTLPPKWANMYELYRVAS
jgi:GTP-binding protein HflX